MTIEFIQVTKIGNSITQAYRAMQCSNIFLTQRNRDPNKNGERI